MNQRATSAHVIAFSDSVEIASLGSDRARHLRCGGRDRHSCNVARKRLRAFGQVRARSSSFRSRAPLRCIQRLWRRRRTITPLRSGKPVIIRRRARCFSPAVVAEQDNVSPRALQLLGFIGVAEGKYAEAHTSLEPLAALSRYQWKTCTARYRGTVSCATHT